MKKVYLSFILFFAVAFFNRAMAQVTLIDDNHSLSGYTLGNNIIMESDNDSTLWISDGTQAGTHQYAFDVKVDGNGGGTFLNNKIYFAGIDATHGSELWVSDGTAAGTTLVADINSSGSSTPDDFVVFGGNLYFTASTAASGREMYKLNGSNGTVSLFKDFNSGAGDGFDLGQIQSYYINNNLLYFMANDGAHGDELWVTNGTAVTMLGDITPGATSTNITAFSHIGSETFFSVATATFSLDIWKTDGTAAGTVVVKSFNLFGSAIVSSMLLFNNKLYFSGTDAAGAELWSTDGTTTELVSDINPGPDGSYPLLFNAVIINNHIIFSATTANEGNELWISDGIKGGSTTLLKDINPGSADASPFLYPTYNYANIYSGIVNSDNIFDRTKLYNGFIFFSAKNATNGRELWRTDGTLAGTVLVKDIYAGTRDGVSDNSYYYTTAGLYFSGNNGTSGNEPFVSNGLSSGTSIVADIYPGTNGSDPEFSFIKSGTLYFTADNGNSRSGYTDFYKIDAALSELPVTLLDFSATLQDNAVQLRWATSSEINSKSFGIQRSTDAVHFNNIGQVDAAGNSSIETKYIYDDDKAFNAGSDVLYYRLLITDKDGKSKYSEVLKVKLKGAITDLRAYPNPVHDHLSVLFNTESSSSASLLIRDVSGKQVYQQVYNNPASAHLQNINVSTFATGTYFIQLITEKGNKTIKFVKQ